MAFTRSSKRYGHTPGYTDCSYSADGDKFLTCGADGDVRIWMGIDDDDPFTQCVGEFTVCCVQYDKRMLVSTDLNSVQAFTYPDCDKDGKEFRFTGNVNCVKVCNGYIAAGSEDTNIKVLTTNNSEEPFDLCDSGGPVLKIDISRNGFLASYAGDGYIRIWNLDTKNVVHSISGLETTKSFGRAKTFGTPSFEPVNGDLLAYPKKREIIVLRTIDWETALTLSDKDISSDYTTCEFSRCGKYIAAGTLTGEISIFSINDCQPLSGDTKSSENDPIASISWNPLNNGELIYCDMSGQLGLIDNIINNRNKIATSTSSLNIENEIDNNAEDLFLESNFQDFDGDNVKNHVMNEEHDDCDTILSDHVRVESRVSEFQPRKHYQQEPFQPSATPEQLEYRYLLWNHIGIVRAHNTDADNSIEVEFHDASIHHGIHMNNHQNHTIASLSENVLALSGKTPSKLVCIALGAAGNREWSIELPDCEEVVAVAASNKLVAIASDVRLLRIFGVMGTQREIISIPGPVVAIAGYKDTLIVAYHSHVATEDQHINGILIQTKGLSLRSREMKLPLSTKAKLIWIGFSDMGSPVTFDSHGTLRMYSYKTNLWFPVCDTNLHVKGASDNFFIVEISERNQILRAILCRGSNYPLTNPRPMISELPLELPFCDMEAERSQMEEKLIRFSNFEIENSEKEIRETSIKLFAVSCRAEMESRAKELIEMLATPQLIPLAMKYASKLGRIHLAEKLGELLPLFEEQQEQRANPQIISDIQGLPFQEEMAASVSIIKQIKENSLKITPKAIKKRNPFKKSTPSTNTLTENPVRHLSENVIGLESLCDSQEIDGTKVITNAESQDIFHSIENTENVNNCNSPIFEGTHSTISFITWFRENKSKLKSEYPEVPASQLTVIGIRKYNAIYPNSESIENKADEHCRPKRKLEDHEKPETGVTKLARFGYTK